MCVTIYKCSAMWVRTSKIHVHCTPFFVKLHQCDCCVLVKSRDSEFSHRRLMTVLLSSRTSLQLTSPCPWTTKSSKIVENSAFCKQSVMYDYMKSINFVTATVNEVTVKNGLLTDYLMISVSKPFFTVSQRCCPWGKSLSLRTNLQVLVSCHWTFLDNYTGWS